MNILWDLLFPFLCAVAFGWLLKTDLKKRVTGTDGFPHVERRKHPIFYWMIIAFLTAATASSVLLFFSNCAALLK